MRRMAAEKIKAAKTLLDQDMAGSALDLALAAMLAAASDAAGKDTPVPPQEAGVWIFGEAIPAGLLDPQDAVPDHERHQPGPGKGGAGKPCRRLWSMMRSGLSLVDLRLPAAHPEDKCRSGQLGLCLCFSDTWRVDQSKRRSRESR